MEEKYIKNTKTGLTAANLKQEPDEEMMEEEYTQNLNSEMETMELESKI